jgi:predicted HTH domain antitoxin
MKQKPYELMFQNEKNMAKTGEAQRKKGKAVELYKSKKASLGLGAQLAGVTLSEFIDLLKEHNVYLNLEKEDVEKALKTAREVF